ncbi:MAG TPA: alpha/beta hydrolase [Rubricoccaceae bacterium]|jgi:acetyl esterase/lipase
MRLALLAAFVLALGGCSLASRVGVGFFYDTADLPEAQIRRDVAYLPDGDSKHRLNLFLPAPGAPARPTVVFVHGGNWDSGDRDLAVGGRDVYNNVGRYLASNGIPTAVISYPFPAVAGGAAVDWRAEARDVAAAMAFVRREQATWGSRGIVGMGHSAGTHLMLHAALNPAFSGPVGRVCGLVPASGAGLDLTAEGAFVGDTYDFFSSRFAPDRVVRTEPPAVPADWQREVSVVPYLTPETPPMLILLGTGESRGLQRQSRLLDEARRARGISGELVSVPARSHALVVPTLSRDDRVAGPAVVAFVNGLTCS